MLSGLLVAATIAADQHRSNWLAGPVLALAGTGVAFLQLILALVASGTTNRRHWLLGAAASWFVAVLHVLAFGRYLAGTT